MKRFFCTSLLLCFLPLAAWSQSLPPDFDGFVSRVLEEFDIPGAGIAVVSEGQVLLADGFGVLDMEAGVEADAHSLFGIASNSKAFTATALGLLVERGQLEWDRPVVEYLPWFRLSDPYVTAELTIRDLLVHRSGLAPYAGDLLWWPPTELSRRTIAERLKYVPLSTSFRSAYAYDNVLYLVAGEVIESISGMTWEEFVRTQIMDVVGMADSNVLHSAAGEGVNVAQPHARVDGVVRKIAPFASDNTNPAGGVNSSAADMARWMITQLNEGTTPDGARLFGEATARELRSPVTPIPVSPPHPLLAPQAANFAGYALGFHAQDYRGEFMLTHGGVLPGYFSRLAMIPGRELGVVVMLNGESGRAHRAIVYHVLDHLMGVESPHDWLGAYAQLEADSRAQSGSDPFAWPDPPSRPIRARASSAYTGDYQDAWYGHVYVEPAAEGLRMRFEHSPSLEGDLVHWDGDTFIARWDDRELRADAYVTFVVDPSGRESHRIEMSWVSDATDVSFDYHDLDLRRARK
ncbi:MAG: CubicO group peptidase (beta-lactamase class C family) [Rhodothermales bacterium]|jgi:CubicO group peptidase (beta-lactamase class C family)